jgi:hypothetical protein
LSRVASDSGGSEDLVVCFVDVGQYHSLIVTGNNERTTVKQWGLGVTSVAEVLLCVEWRCLEKVRFRYTEGRP